eukprot:scaffold32456_cov53-Phaeocystis_antarctica.AAC.2
MFEKADLAPEPWARQTLFLGTDQPCALPPPVLPRLCEFCEQSPSYASVLARASCRRRPVHHMYGRTAASPPRLPLGHARQTCSQSVSRGSGSRLLFSRGASLPRGGALSRLCRQAARLPAAHQTCSTLLHARQHPSCWVWSHCGTARPTTSARSLSGASRRTGWPARYRRPGGQSWYVMHVACPP